MCTNFKTKKAKDGGAVVGRSMEFPFGIPTALGVLPSDHRGQARTPTDGDQGHSWQANYGVVGMSAFQDPAMLTDGMNTAGVSAHLLYMPDGYCTYQPVSGQGNDISEMDLIPFILGTCSDTAEAKAAIASVNVWGLDPGMGFAPPLHLLVHDTDTSIAIEFHEGGTRVVDNPLGVGTNAPFLEWHLTNLGNYVGLSARSPSDTSVLTEKISPFGQGQGLMGLPGDYSAASRFVRAATMIALSDQTDSAQDAELQALHILNAFDIPPGLIREPGQGGAVVDEVTVWASISNLSQRRYGYRTNGDPQPYVVELDDVDFSAAARTVPMSWSGGFAAVAV